MKVRLILVILGLTLFISCNQEVDKIHMKCEASNCVIQKISLENIADLGSYRINESVLPKGVKIYYKNENHDDVDYIEIFGNPFVTTIIFDSLGKIKRLDSYIPEVTNSTMRDTSGYRIHLKFDSLGQSVYDFHPVWPLENISVDSIVESIKSFQMKK